MPYRNSFVVGLVYEAASLWARSHQVYAESTANPDSDAMRPEKRLFKYSILYQFILFGALVVDRWVLA